MDKNRPFQSYEKFSSLLLDDHVYRDPSVTFSSICKEIGADPSALGRLVEDEMGMSADALIEAYRAQER